MGHLNFGTNAGDYLCIVEESGSGKNTLMGTILGLQPPLVGAAERGDGFRANETRYLPQQTLVQRDFLASVEEIVLSGQQGRTGFWPFYRKAGRESAEKNTERVGTTAFRKRCYRELLGGQQQRVLLAWTLYTAEKMLLLNESISGLSPKIAVDMYQLVQGLNEEGITTTIISRGIVAAVQYAGHILHISKEVFSSAGEGYQHSRLDGWLLQEGNVNA